MKNHSCGGCQYFQKRKNWTSYLKNTPNAGVCELKDCRVSSDNGHDCEEWKHKKVEREPKVKVKYYIECCGLEVREIEDGSTE